MHTLHHTHVYTYFAYSYRYIVYVRLNRIMHMIHMMMTTTMVIIIIIKRITMSIITRVVETSSLYCSRLQNSKRRLYILLYECLQLYYCKREDCAGKLTNLIFKRFSDRRNISDRKPCNFGQVLHPIRLLRINALVSESLRVQQSSRLVHRDHPPTN